MKNLLSKIITGAMITFPSLSNAQITPEPTPTPLYEIAIAQAPPDDITEKIVFRTLDEGLDYYPKTASGTVRLITYPGTYNSAKDFIVLKDREIVGKYPVISPIKIDASKSLLEPEYNPAIIEGRIQMKSNSRLSRIVKIGAGYSFVGIYDRGEDNMQPSRPVNNIEVSENYFKNNVGECNAITLVSPETNNVSVFNNIFSNSEVGAIIGNVQKGTPIITRNIFYNCDKGIMANEVKDMFLGDEEIAGENIFMGNRKNMVLYNPIGTFDAVYNLWYDENKELVTSEEDILKTIEINLTHVSQTQTYSDSTSTSATINVLPCLTDDPYVTRASSWQFY